MRSPNVVGPPRSRIHLGRASFEQRLDEGAADATVSAGDQRDGAGNANDMECLLGWTEQTGRFSQGLILDRPVCIVKAWVPEASVPPATVTGVGDRLLTTASELFYREGVRAVGIQRVIDEAGVAKASLYAHFESKDELVAACLDKRISDWRSHMEEHLRGPRSTLAASCCCSSTCRSNGSAARRSGAVPFSRSAPNSRIRSSGQARDGGAPPVAAQSDLDARE